MTHQSHAAFPAGVRAVTCCRVSTDAQEKDGTSLDPQEQACIEYASRAWLACGGAHPRHCQRATPWTGRA